MKRKISVSLSPDVLARIDRLAGSKLSRSAAIEHVLGSYFRERARRRIYARDLERLNAAAKRLNAEIEDVLPYQTLDDSF